MKVSVIACIGLLALLSAAGFASAAELEMYAIKYSPDRGVVMENESLSFVLFVKNTAIAAAENTNVTLNVTRGSYVHNFSCGPLNVSGRGLASISCGSVTAWSNSSTINVLGYVQPVGAESNATDNYLNMTITVHVTGTIVAPAVPELHWAIVLLAAVTATAVVAKKED